jgi:hypothetical protein
MVAAIEGLSDEHAADAAGGAEDDEFHRAASSVLQVPSGSAPSPSRSAMSRGPQLLALALVERSEQRVLGFLLRA